MNVGSEMVCLFIGALIGGLICGLAERSIRPEGDRWMICGETNGAWHCEPYAAD